MAHWIIYDAREEVRGFDLYEHSPGFPASMQKSIKGFCTCINSEGNSEEAVNLRYAPLGKYYVLSVIFRKPRGSIYSVRSTHRIVNFLLDSAEADYLFKAPFSQTGRWMIDEAEKILTDPERAQFPGINALTEKVDSSKRKLHENWVSPAILLGAASYCAEETTLNDQAFIGLPSPCSSDQALVEIEKMMSLLPQMLRKTVSFQTWIFSAVESNGIAVNFGSASRIEALVRASFPSGPNTDKHVYYVDTKETAVVNPDDRTNRIFGTMEKAYSQMVYIPWMFLAITEWDTYLSLNRTLHTCRSSTEIFGVLDEAVWIRLLKRTPSEAVLQAMKKDCPKHYKDLREHIREQLSYYEAISMVPHSNEAVRDAGKKPSKPKASQQTSQKESEPADEKIPQTKEEQKNAGSPQRRSSRRFRLSLCSECRKSGHSPKGTKSAKSRKLNAASLKPYAGVALRFGGVLCVMWLLWKALTQLMDLQVRYGNVSLNITISLNDTINGLRNLSENLLWGLAMLLIVDLIRAIRKMRKKK